MCSVVDQQMFTKFVNLRDVSFSTNKLKLDYEHVQILLLVKVLKD